MRYILVSVIIFVCIGILAAKSCTKQEKPVKISFEDNLKNRTFRVFYPPYRATAVNLKDGIALTAKHVCEKFDFDGGMLISKGDFKYHVNKIVLDGDTYSDLCLMYYDTNEHSAQIPETKVSDIDGDLPGTEMFICGFSSSDYISLNRGTVNRLYVEEHIGSGYIFKENEVSAKTDHGISGSGCFNKSMELIGIASIVAADPNSPYGTGTVPLSKIRAFLESQGLLDKED